MTIVHVACAGVEHMGRVEGEGWKKPKQQRKMIVLEDAVKITYIQDEKGNVIMNLNDMKKRHLPGAPIETKYEGTVYLNPGLNPIYIWPLKTGGDLHRIYLNTLSEIIQPESKIVGPTGAIPMQRQPHQFPRDPGKGRRH